MPELAKKWSFGIFRPNLPQLRLFHPYFVCKVVWVISMIKMVLDQSKPISLIFINKKSKIQKSQIAPLLFIKPEIRQVYNPF